MIINTEDNWIFEVKNTSEIQNRHLQTPAVKEDLYTLDGEPITKNVPYIVFSTGGEYCIMLEYNVDEQYIETYQADGDVC